MNFSADHNAWTAEAIATDLGISVSAVQAHARRGTLVPPAWRAGRTQIWSTEQVLAFKNARRRPGRPRRPQVDTTTTAALGSQKSLGAFYTPLTAAAFMANWAIRRPVDRLLEPSFGDGIFLRAVKQVHQARNWDHPPAVLGHEINNAAATAAVEHGLIAHEDVLIGDFLTSKGPLVDAVVGNPPYVRLRALPEAQRSVALAAAEAELGQRMDPSGSAWMPFTMRAASRLVQGGRLAFVLPWEFTHVRYANPLWTFLASRFGALTLIRVQERIFPDLNQDVVLLLADEYGSETDLVLFKTYRSSEHLVNDLYASHTVVNVADLMTGARPFQAALISDSVRAEALELLGRTTQASSELGRFNIGYVSGNKGFFHPSAETVRKFNLPATSLHASLSDARSLRGGALRTSELNSGTHLWLPGEILTAGERKYISYGEQEGVHRAYKCAIRDPWYRVPYVKTPDVTISVFGDKPLLMVNDAKHKASNSMICGFLDSEPLEFAGRWYSSLTSLSVELEVHSLGGGVFVLVPNEAGRVRVTSKVANPNDLNKIADCLRSRRAVDAYEVRDSDLINAFGASAVQSLKVATQELRQWRVK